MLHHSELLKDIHLAGLDAKYDTAVKHLLANKWILAWILKSCVEEYREVEISEIVSKYIEGEAQISEVKVLPDETNSTIKEKIDGTSLEDATLTEGTIFYDIRFHAIAPKDGKLIQLIINLEAQNDYYPGYPLTKRGIYYCARLISAQYGSIFTNSQYDKIRKVYSIWICTNPPNYKKNTITSYSIKETNHVGNTKETKENYDLLTMVMIYLGRKEDKNYKGVLKLLDVLLSSDLQAMEKKEILEEDFEIPMVTLERQVQEMCNLSKGIAEKNLEKGISQGLTQGILEGQAKQIIEMGREFGLSDEQIIERLQNKLQLTKEEAMKYFK